MEDIGDRKKKVQHMYNKRSPCPSKKETKVV